MILQERDDGGLRGAHSMGQGSVHVLDGSYKNQLESVESLCFCGHVGFRVCLGRRDHDELDSIANRLTAEAVDYAVQTLESGVGTE